MHIGMICFDFGSRCQLSFETRSVNVLRDVPCNCQPITQKWGNFLFEWFVVRLDTLIRLSSKLHARFFLSVFETTVFYLYTFFTIMRLIPCDAHAEAEIA